MRITALSNQLEKADSRIASEIPWRCNLADLVRACSRDIEKFRQWDERCEALLELLKKPVVASCIGRNRLEGFTNQLRRFDTLLHNHIIHAKSVLSERQRLWRTSGFNHADLIQAKQQGIKEANQFGLPKTDEARRFIALAQEIERSLVPYKSLLSPSEQIKPVLRHRVAIHLN